MKWNEAGSNWRVCRRAIRKRADTWCQEHSTSGGSLTVSGWRLGLVVGMKLSGGFIYFL
jgi:hypothetical protein